MKILQKFVIIFLNVVFYFFSSVSFAQYVEIKTNLQEETLKDSIKVEENIELLFNQNKNEYYQPYLKYLIENKKFKLAEKIVLEQIQQNKFGLIQVLYIDLGNVYAKQGKEIKAKEQFQKVLNTVNGDAVLTRQLAKSFIEIERFDYAIIVYQHSSDILMNPNLYSTELANLYVKTNQLDKAIDILLAVNRGLSSNVENAKTILLQLLGNDAEKLKQVQKIIIKKINEQPDNIYLVEILTWIYTQKNDWDGALMQIEAIDERNKEPGKRLLDFARNAINEKQYDIADKAYNDIIAKGADLPFYIVAQSEQLSTNLFRLKNNSDGLALGFIDSLEKKYERFTIENPMFKAAQIALDYAFIEANYANNTLHAIEILQNAILRPDIRRDLVGMLKLQMGDYYLLLGKIWDASLTYSQVDKEFKQDVMGEDARFRNAKLAYYRGDFIWAQRQLLILKSATSELIANDALALSVLITENVEDSITYPLCRFAAAGLLLAQNKDKEANELLDSISKSFPKHPLADDILMLHAQIAEKHHDYEKALHYFQQIHQQYGTDVLGDDAVLKMAELYQNKLNNKDKAKQLYEQLIIEYPGSTFIQIARQRLYEINNPTPP